MTRQANSTNAIFDAATPVGARVPLRSKKHQAGWTAPAGDEDAGRVPIRPTLERAQHDRIETFAGPFGDGDDPENPPMRVKDRWSRMEEAGTIDGPMRRAVYRFRRDFAFAGLETLRAGPLIRLARSTRGADPGERRLDARRFVWAALEALGGASGPSGSVVWHCVGRDETVKDWAIRQSWAGRTPLNETAAKGVLLAALWTLAEHYRRRDKLERERRERATLGETGA
jgi:Domain of unknown function (DUF6456)